VFFVLFVVTPAFPPKEPQMFSDNIPVFNKIGPHGETVGAVVHYVHVGELAGVKLQIIAALVTQVNDDGTAGLKLLFPVGVKDYPAEPYSETYRRGCWSWPPKS
jgi:hypothetical protein